MAKTIEQYLQVLDNYTFSDNAIGRALVKHGIASQSVVDSLTERQRDLAEAEMWYAASSLVNGGGGSVKFGLQSRASDTISASVEMRNSWKEQSRALRIKWGEVPLDDDKVISDASHLWQ